MGALVFRLEDGHGTAVAPGRHRAAGRHHQRVQRHLQPRRWRHDRWPREPRSGPRGRHETSARGHRRAFERTRRAFAVDVLSPTQEARLRRTWRGSVHNAGAHRPRLRQQTASSLPPGRRRGPRPPRASWWPFGYVRAAANRLRTGLELPASARAGPTSSAPGPRSSKSSGPASVPPLTPSPSHACATLSWLGASSGRSSIALGEDGAAVFPSWCADGLRETASGGLDDRSEEVRTGP